MPANGSGFWERIIGTLIPFQGPLLSNQVNQETNNLLEGINFAISKTNAAEIALATEIDDLSASNNAFYSSLSHRSTAAAYTYDAAVQYLRLGGFYQTGDGGGGIYKRLASVPGVLNRLQFTSNAGTAARWRIEC
jgi:hypothetical protein